MAAAALACAFVSDGVAEARLTRDQATRLARGELIVVPTTRSIDGRKYVGGVSYLVVDAPAERLSRVARDVSRTCEILPRCVSAALLSVDPDGMARVRVTHAVGPFSGGYTLDIGFTQGGHVGRFWLDRRSENDVDDAWGFIRLTPLPRRDLAPGGRTLVTYGILVDLGTGLVPTLFEARIQQLALSYPRRLADAAARP